MHPIHHCFISKAVILKYAFMYRLLGQTYTNTSWGTFHNRLI